MSVVLKLAAKLMGWTMVSIVGFYARIFPPAEIDKGDSERAGRRTDADGMAGSARAQPIAALNCGHKLRQISLIKREFLPRRPSSSKERAGRRWTVSVTALMGGAVRNGWGKNVK